MDPHPPEQAPDKAPPAAGSTTARRLTADDFDPAVLRLFDRYVHGLIDRRGFLDGAARHAGVAGAAALLAALSPDFAQAQQVSPSDPRIVDEMVDLVSPKGNGKIRALLVRPAKITGQLPLVLVVHENRGLNPHIQDIARRLAVDGFITLAPDALGQRGGYPGDEDKARAMFALLDPAKAREDFVAAAEHLVEWPQGNGRLGVVGFCYGGSIANLLATRLPGLRAAVPFYGSAPPLDTVAGIQAEMLLHFAGNDERINADWPAYEAALKAAGVRYEAHTYTGTQHGFNNDTTPRYDASAAALAWQRTLALFNRTLRS
jgi:carboxymethylenebutenolidase